MIPRRKLHPNKFYFSVSQKFEKLHQINNFIETAFSDLQIGFRKNHGMPHCLVKKL